MIEDIGNMSDTPLLGYSTDTSDTVMNYGLNFMLTFFYDRRNVQ